MLAFSRLSAILYKRIFFDKNLMTNPNAVNLLRLLHDKIRGLSIKPFAFISSRENYKRWQQSLNIFTLNCVNETVNYKKMNGPNSVTI